MVRLVTLSAVACAWRKRLTCRWETSIGNGEPCTSRTARAPRTGWVHLSPDAGRALLAYLRVRRPGPKVTHVFLVEKGPLTGQPLSIRGIQAAG